MMLKAVLNRGRTISVRQLGKTITALRVKFVYNTIEYKLVV
jgi:hypothetical protein